MKEAQEAQLRAADPNKSSWVAANAGSGKTRVLTDRVARLLLEGNEPQKILCLTYTKAAASEMQTRLFGTLGSWSMLDDDRLKRELAKLTGTEENIPQEELSAARRLFARALETPGGLKIQTIHAFCEALLRQFPLEAGVAPQFQVLDERQSRALNEELMEQLAEGSPELMAKIAQHLTSDDIFGLMQEIGRNRPSFLMHRRRNDLAKILQVDPALTIESLLSSIILPGDFETLTRLTGALAESGTSDRSAALTLSNCLNENPFELLAGLERVLLTGGAAKSPFTAKIGSFPTKAVRQANTDLIVALEPIMERVEAARPQRLAIAALDRSTALHEFAFAWLSLLDTVKNARGLLDFDDMINRTQQLLSSPSAAAWVLWRLDGGLDHVLVDEAQDTSPTQWDVVKDITSEFFAGESARGPGRTIFIVGDEKQSIYSFQGADPAAFGEMQQHFSTMLDSAFSQLQDCDLIYSFRSAKPVLEIVDAVFDGPAGEGLARQVTHQAFQTGLPGRVEVWPFLPKPEQMEEQPWYEPVDLRGAEDPINILAGRISDQIALWLKSGTHLPATDETDDRPVRAGDIMILVQRRNALFHAIIRALKRAEVPVAGADVLRVGAELAVKDLLACLRVVSTPADDLSLAAMLRSPLGEITEDDLFQLAHGRESNLWPELQKQTEPQWRYSIDLITDLRKQVDFLRPFEMLQRILIRHDGRKRLVARLGAEADDGIDALLDQAIDYERSNAPTLAGFLTWIDRDELQIKRRVDDTNDQVRVMTVHGAKGLEAPIVILPDTVDRSEAKTAPEIWKLSDGTAVWRMPSGQSPDVFQEAEEMRRAKARAENMRLLYVAMTRARSWLIVCGAGSDPKTEGNSWYRLISNAVGSLSHDHEPGPDGDIMVMEYRWRSGTGVLHGSRVATSVPVTLPKFANLRTPPPKENRVIRPSQLGGAHSILRENEWDSDEGALARGDLIHALLEAFAAHPAPRWLSISKKIIPADNTEAGALLEEAMTVMKSSHSEMVFGPGTLAEVDVSASLPALGGTKLRGRIDRLVITANEVLAVDIKSNRLIPSSQNLVPEAILRQMGAYRAALSCIWPKKRINTAILWTADASLMHLQPNMVDDAFARSARLDQGLVRS